MIIQSPTSGLSSSFQAVRRPITRQAHPQVSLSEIRFGEEKKKSSFWPRLRWAGLILIGLSLAGDRYFAKPAPPEPRFVQPGEGWTVVASNNARVQKAQKQDQIIEDLIADQNNATLSTVDEALIKAKLGKLKDKVEHHADRLHSQYIFTLNDNSGKKLYLVKPQEPAEIKRLEEGLQAEGIDIVELENNTAMQDWIRVLLPSLMSFLLIGYMLNRTGMLSMGTLKLNAEKPDTRFSDVGGYDGVVHELKTVLDLIRDPGKNKLGAKVPRGILMVGPPGTGKTHLARAVAGESDVPFFSLSGSDFVEMYAGRGAARIRHLFKSAKQMAEVNNLRNQPFKTFVGSVFRMIGQNAEAMAKKAGGCIIFIDEIDALGKQRRSGGQQDGGTQEQEQSLNQLLVEMDGFGKDSQVMVIGATNRADVLDEALRRRFTMLINVPAPVSWQQRRDILDKILQKSPVKDALAPEVDLDWVARNTQGFTGDKLKTLVENATLQALYQGKAKVDMGDFREAYTQVFLGRRQSEALTPEEKQIVAIHEHGHGLMALACGWAVDIVSMVARENSGGHVMLAPDQVKPHLPSKNERLKLLLYTMGGRAAERVRLGAGEETSGAKMDLKQARDLIREMLSDGMLEGLFGADYRNPDIKLSTEHEKLMDQLIDQALTVSEDILKTIPDGPWETLVADSLKGHDYQGKEAMDYYADRLSADFNWEPARKRVQEFLETPLPVTTSPEKTA